MKRIAVLGEIGSGNLGDDFGFIRTRDVILRAAAARGLVVDVDAIGPGSFSRLDVGYDAVVTGCGTLLDHCDGAYMSRLLLHQKRGTRTAILGSGVSDPQHLPPTNQGTGVFRAVREGARYAWIRGEDGPDIYWQWLGGASGPKAPVKQARVGVNMGHAAFTNAPIAEIGAKMKRLFERLVADPNTTPVIVSAWKADDYWYETWPTEGVERIHVNGSRASCEALATLDAVAAFRGHLSVTAACCGVRPLPVVFSTKVRAMWAHTDVPNTLLATKHGEWYDLVVQSLGVAYDSKPAVEAASAEVDKHIWAFFDSIGDIF